MAATDTSLLSAGSEIHWWGFSAGIGLFLPCTPPLARFLERRFQAEDREDSARFISNVDAGVHEAALEAPGK